MAESINIAVSERLAQPCIRIKDANDFFGSFEYVLTISVWVVLLTIKQNMIKGLVWQSIHSGHCVLSALGFKTIDHQNRGYNP